MHVYKYIRTYIHTYIHTLFSTVQNRGKSPIFGQKRQFLHENSCILNFQFSKYAFSAKKRLKT